MEVKMKNLQCPLCEEAIYSELGKGCRMCGMSINKDEKFCSKICEEKYEKINNKMKGG